jgi:hypothetical protein
MSENIEVAAHRVIALDDTELTPLPMELSPELLANAFNQPAFDPELSPLPIELFPELIANSLNEPVSETFVAGETSRTTSVPRVRRPRE